MSIDANFELLSRIPIFAGLAQPQIAAIIVKAKKTFFETGEKLVEAGATGDAAYIILSGKATSEGAATIGHAIETLLPGALVGELGMLVEMTYTTTVVATERIRCLAITREGLYQVMQADPSMARHFSDKLMQRLLDLAEELRAVDAQFAEIEASFATAG
ncbi:MAG: cyclic nucleotide-binding domain-containing protein [Hyphomicrobiales bacterium]|nr:cyclic nucleotide-binding domain-containing protein [Hyphomicrobiales bacterium]